MITRVAEKYNIRTHIVHLSAANALPLIKKFRSKCGNRLTVETCHHYLNLKAEDVPKNRVDFKCCPPIRDEHNQIELWNGLKNGDINMVVSDHSPSTAEQKLLVNGPDYGNFIKSWGGISSVQFGKCNNFILIYCNSIANLLNEFIELIDIEINIDIDIDIEFGIGIVIDIDIDIGIGIGLASALALPLGSVLALTLVLALNEN